MKNVFLPTCFLIKIPTQIQLRLPHIFLPVRFCGSRVGYVRALVRLQPPAAGLDVGRVGDLVVDRCQRGRAQAQAGSIVARGEGRAGGEAVVVGGEGGRAATA